MSKPLLYFLLFALFALCTLPCGVLFQSEKKKAYIFQVNEFLLYLSSLRSKAKEICDFVLCFAFFFCAAVLVFPVEQDGLSLP